MKGILAFENRIKEDTPKLMNKLKQSNIESKIITGDNVFIAVETAIRCGLLGERDKVIVLEGKNQST